MREINARFGAHSFELEPRFGGVLLFEKLDEIFCADIRCPIAAHNSELIHVRQTRKVPSR